MTDTDKLKRLAEAVFEAGDPFVTLGDVADYGAFQSYATPQAILALIAESERLRGVNAKRAATIADLVMERDEAVALLREVWSVASVSFDADSEWEAGYLAASGAIGDAVRPFLARIDATDNTVA